MAFTWELLPLLETRIRKNQRKLPRLTRNFWQAQSAFVQSNTEDLTQVRITAEAVVVVCDKICRDVEWYHHELQNSTASEVA